MFVQSAPVGWRLLKRQGIVLKVCEQDEGAEGTKRVFDGLQEKGAGMRFLLSGIVERALLGRELARVFAWRAVASHRKVPRQFRLFSDRLR
jgi:hypothetical protein